MSTVDDVVTRGRNLTTEQLLVLAVGIGAVLLVGDLIVGILDGSYSISRVGRYVVQGILYGLIMGLAGIGLSMTYSILNFANFAHGDTVTAGAFIGWGGAYLVAGWGAATVGQLALVGPQQDITGAELGISITSTPIAVFVGLLLAGIGSALFVLLIDRLAYKPMRGAGGIPLLITSIGVAFALRYLIMFVFSSQSRGTTASVPSADLLLVDGYVSLDAHDATLIAAAVVLMIGVHLLLQRTKLGKAMRAMSDNRDLALVTGIPTEQVIRWTWLIGGGLAGSAGYLMVLWTGTIDWQFGWLLLLLIFAAVILGGIGSIYGAIFGGLIIGVSMHVSMIWLPGGDFTTITAFLMMILVLLIKPSGLFGGKTTA